MFTGLIEEIGTIVDVRHQGGSVLMTIEAEKIMSDLAIDNSVNINGACQTVIQRTERTFTVQAVEETLQKTTLKHLRHGDLVNLERALTLSSRLGCHLVAGHVDCLGRVINRNERTSSILFTIQIDEKWLRYVVEQGSIAVDGVSLTVAQLASDRFTVSIIPYTLGQTTLQDLKIGQSVNIEVDIIGKYIERFVKKPDSTLDWGKLKTLGY